MSIEEKLRLIQEGVLHEAYYGKNPTLLKCEQLLDQALTSQTGGYAEIKQVETILKELFNFERLVISTIPLLVAATIPITVYKFKYISGGMELKRTSTGVAFKDEDHVEALIFIDLTTMVMCKVTGAEILACILHEIGHSMQAILPSQYIGSAVGAVNFASAIVRTAVFTLLGTSFLMGAEKIDEIYGKISEKVSKGNREIDASASKAVNEVLRLGNTLIALQRLWFIIKNKKKDWFNILKQITGIQKVADVVRVAIRSLQLPSAYKAEIFADYIPSIYGYSNELSTALAKFEAFGRSGITNNALTRLIKLPFNIVSKVLDPHPLHLSRMKFMINNLEAELEKGINKDAYDIIKKDLDALRKNLDEFITEMNKQKIKNIDIIVYKKFMGAIIDGRDDVKGLFFGMKPEDLDQLDRLEETQN